MGGRHHLGVDLGGTPVLGYRPRRVQSPNRGLVMARHPCAGLVPDALDMAVRQRRPKLVIYHSDLGCHYISHALGERCLGWRVAWSGQWARLGTASTTLGPRASSPRSTASCSTALSSVIITKPEAQSSSSSRGGTIRIVVTGASVNSPRWPSREITGKLHETQALNCPLNRGNSKTSLNASCGKDARDVKQPAATPRALT